MAGDMPKTTTAVPERAKTAKRWGLSLDLWLAIGVTLLLAGAGIFLGWDNNRTVPVLPYPSFHYLAEPHNPLHFLASWDGADYLHIAAHGYTNPFWINWFPLYPLLINLLSRVIASPLVAALVIAWGSLVGALYFYIKIVRWLFKVDAVAEPLRALLFFVLFPTGVFLIVPFSESLYALLALGAIYSALERRWLAAGLFTLLCTATHITGPFIVLLAGLILLEEGVRWRQVVAGAIIGSLGLLSYITYLQVNFHKPFGFIESQKIYHHWADHGVWNLITTATPLNVLSVGLVIAAAAYWWRRRRSLAWYSLFFLAILIVGRQYGDFDRYVLMDFSIPLAAYGYLRERAALYGYAAAATGIAWVYFLLHYMGGYIGG